MKVAGDNPFVACLVRDLAAFSPELLDTGATQGGAEGAWAGEADGFHGVYRSARKLAALVPALLLEAEADPRESRWEEHRSRIPVRARISGFPADWTAGPRGPVPVYWRSIQAVERPDEGPLRWVLFLIETIDERLSAARIRNAKQLEDARAGAGPAGALDALAIAALERREERLRASQAELSGARSELFRRAGGPLFPSEVVPQPFPGSPSWRALLRMAREILDPIAGLRAGIGEVLSQRVGMADVPWLYQRWCGLQLLGSLARAGAAIRGDTVAALYAGGRLEVLHRGVRTLLFVEPRLTRNGTHASGYYACRGPEASPDFLIVTPGPDGTDAFCLDATLSTTDEILRGKFRYLDLLASLRMVRIAGTPTRKPPLWAWAMAPLVREKCELSSPDGSRGIVPMNPLRWSSQPLDDWAADVLRHAGVWGLREPAHDPHQTDA